MSRFFNSTRVREHVLNSIDAAELAEVELNDFDRIYISWSKAAGTFLGELFVDGVEWSAADGWDGSDGTEALCNVITALTTKLRKPDEPTYPAPPVPDEANDAIGRAIDAQMQHVLEYEQRVMAAAGLCGWQKPTAEQHEARKLREAGERHDRDKMRHELMQYAHSVQPECCSRVAWERVVIACVEHAESVDFHSADIAWLSKKRIDEAAQVLQLYLETP